MKPKPVEQGDLPKEIAAKIVADMQRLIDLKREGFASVTQLARKLGVSQPSASAWLAGRAQPSFATAQRFSKETGISYPEIFGEYGMRWRALAELIQDGFDARKAFTAVDTAAFDRSANTVSWGDYYKLAKAGLTGGGAVASDADLSIPATRRGRTRAVAKVPGDER